MSALTDVREHRTHTEEGNLIRKPTITINRSRSLPAESTETTPLAHISPTKYLSVYDKNEIKILSIFSAFKEGKLPSNEQMKRFLNKILNILRSERKKQRLSGEGRELLEEFKGLVKVSKEVISRKNSDEDFQELVWCLTEIAKKGAVPASEYMHITNGIIGEYIEYLRNGEKKRFSINDYFIIGGTAVSGADANVMQETRKGS